MIEIGSLVRVTRVPPAPPDGLFAALNAGIRVGDIGRVVSKHLSVGPVFWIVRIMRQGGDSMLCEPYIRELTNDEKQLISDLRSAGLYVD